MLRKKTIDHFERYEEKERY